MARSHPHPARRTTRLGVCWILLALGAGCDTNGNTTPPRPNIILISIDTLNRSALRSFEPDAHPLPALDAFAARALAFERCYSTAPWTLPAHASLMTGLYPDRHHAIGMQFAMTDSAETLAGALRRHGYRTVGFVGGGYVGPRYGFGKGFDRYDSLPPRQVGTVKDNAQAMFTKATTLLEQRDPGAPPLFLFLHTYVLHNYFKAQPWATSRVAGHQLRSSEHYFACLRGEAPGSDEDWRVLRALYAAELTEVDRAFGEFQATLQRLGIRDETLVIFTTDHGEGFDPARQRIHHCGRQHEDLVRIPMLIGGAGVAAGTTRTPVSMVDVMPTLLDWLGLDAVPNLDGTSFAATLRGQTQPKTTTHFSMEYSYWWQDGRLTTTGRPSRQPVSYAFMWEDLWYIRDRDREQLYDMSADPQQRSDLSGKSELLDAVRRRAALDNDGQTDPTTQLEMANRLREELRSLGYIK